MIEPLSLKASRFNRILIEPHFATSQDKPGGMDTVETYTLTTGPHKGAAVAHVRYLSDTMDTDYPWQVIKERPVAGGYRLHYSTVKTYEQALHLVMACAYEYVALATL